MNTIDLFKSLSEPVRLRILHLLRNADPELCVCDLVAVLELPQGTVSRHLMQLRQIGWVNVRRDGIWMYYSLSAPNSSAHRAMLDCLKQCFDDEPVLCGDVKRFRALKKSKLLSCGSLQGSTAPPKPPSFIPSKKKSIP